MCEELESVWAKFSTLSLAVWLISMYCSKHTHTNTHSDNDKNLTQGPML
jgi:hypothetical protein